MSNFKKLKLDLELAQYFKRGPPKDSKISKQDILSPQYIEQQLTCKSHEPQKTNHILLFTVLNPTYPDLKYSPPVTCNVLNNICSPIGKVLRIVIFKKNGVQAMVEFESVDAAKTAKENLHGSDIYSCTLKIEYAKQNKLNVYKNDSDTYDFTNPNLGKGFDMDDTNGYSTGTTSQQQPNQNAYKNMDLREKIPKVSKEKPIKDLSPEPSKSLSLPSTSTLSAPSRTLSTPKMSLSPVPELVPISSNLSTPNSSTDSTLLNETVDNIEVQIKNKTIECFEKSNIEAKCEFEKLKNDEKILKEEAESKNKTIESFKNSYSEANSELEKMKHNNKILKEEAESKNKTIESLKKTYSEAKRELENLTEEVESKTKKIKALEESQIGNKKESSAKFHKIKEILATKIFLANSSDENLISLLNDDIEKLFEKYDQIVTSTKDSDKLKEITETLADVKVKLSLQTQKRELYDKQFNEIMDILNFSKVNRCIGNILPALKELKESHCELQDQIETEHYSKAQSVIETFSNEQNSVN